MITRRLSALFLAVALAAAPIGPAAAFAAQLQVAVAANFTKPAKEIAAAFEAQTGDQVLLSFGASGQFYTQISQGAPFEVFLSADAERPAKAEQAGFGVPGTRFTYAIGRLVLFSTTSGLVDDRGAVLSAGRFEKISIADPATAPYGAAAVQTMQKLGLYDQLKPKIVQGVDITQAYQFAETGAAELGFVALSQVINEPGGSRWLVPAGDYAPIEQQAILLKTGAGDSAAKAFLAFLKGPKARAIIKRYGYEVR
ncbi:MAG TPA: molybdate ABC transporter substrate-binding protein [Caulobacteraceae bacterium]|nr:molybdate ABC transporter substrate-binding protein [Caulobacteraceae bacterium]